MTSRVQFQLILLAAIALMIVAGSLHERAEEQRRPERETEAVAIDVEYKHASPHHNTFPQVVVLSTGFVFVIAASLVYLRWTRTSNVAAIV